MCRSHCACRWRYHSFLGWGGGPRVLPLDTGAPTTSLTRTPVQLMDLFVHFIHFVNFWVSASWYICRHRRTCHGSTVRYSKYVQSEEYLSTLGKWPPFAQNSLADSGAGYQGPPGPPGAKSPISPELTCRHRGGEA